MDKRQYSFHPRLRYLAALCALLWSTAVCLHAQTSSKTDEKTAANKTAVSGRTPDEEDSTVVLSPFTVDVTKDKGYFAENTLAGSRMKTKLSDLGASISVVTKQQMEDFASTDVNDIFRYEVNTEGSNTYTPMTLSSRGDGIVDVNAGVTLGGSTATLTNASANRVRGLGTPSAAINYYQVKGLSAAVPVDSYNVQSVEISRGPNSMLFGMGSPAGIVNQTTAQAQLTATTNKVEVRTDDRGSFRSSFSFNRPLIKDRLAVYGAVLYDDKEFQRKPSYDITQRQYAALTFKPFTKTTLSANFENYRNRNQRPNSITPVDFVTQWNLAGRPSYDALTKKVTLLSTGQVVGPYASSNSNVLYAQGVRDYVRSLPGYNPALRGTSATALGGTDSSFTFYNGYSLFGLTALNPAITAAQPNPFADPLYVPGMAEVNPGRALMQILDGRLQSWTMPLYTQTYRTGYNNPAGGNEHTFPIDNFSAATTSASTAALWANPTWSDIYNRDMYQSTGWTNNSFVSNIGSYKYPGVTDRSIYDWKKINISQANHGTQQNQNYNVELQQEFTRDLFLNAGWFRQDFKQKTNYTVGQLNSTALRIDENKYLTDGTPNPFFGLPFVSDSDPDQFANEEVDDHFRAMLAYTPDFTRKAGWLKWLGHHQLLGLWSRDESMAIVRRKRLSYIAANGPAASYRFLPNPNNGAITATSGPNGETGWVFANATQRNFYLANPGDPLGKVTRASGPWEPQTFTGNIKVYNYSTSSFEDATVTEQYATFDAPVRNQGIVNSISAGITDYWWNDRLVTTFGARLDKVKQRSTTTGTVLNADGTVTPALTPFQKFGTDGLFDDSSMWNRFNPWSRYTGRTKTGGGVLRPFAGWSAIDRRANEGHPFWQFVQSFGVSYNWSNNFDAPTRAEVDPFGKALPKPMGVGHDFGLQFAALEGKLFTRISWFTASNENQRNTSDAALGRLTGNVDTNIFRAWARVIAEMNLGLDPSQTVPAAQETAVQAGAEAAWKLPYNYYTNLPGALVPTQDTSAKGVEIQINYNSKSWRNRFTFGKQETINSNGMTQYDAWYAVRVPLMLNANAANFLTPAALAQYQSAATAAGHAGSIGYQTTTGSFVDITNFWTGYGFGGISQNDASGNTTPGNFFANNVTPNATLSKALNGQAAPGQRKYRWAYNTGYDFSSGMLKGFGVGGAERWESKSVIGYLGRPGGTTLGSSAVNPNLLDTADVTKPVYSGANYYTDLFVRYKRRIWSDRLGWTLQLNVENVTEGGHLQVTAVNYDGSPYAYRIIDSRKFTLTSAFDF